MIVFDNCNSTQYTNTVREQKFNGMLLNVYILGSSYRKSDSFIGERLAGCANIARPWTSFGDLQCSCKHILSISIITLMNDFKLSYHEDYTDVIIQTLLDRYSDSNIQLKMSDLSMAYCYALFKLQYVSNMDCDEQLVKELVTGLLLDLYSNEQQQIISESHEDHTIADSIFADLLSTPMVINRDGFEEIYKKYGINKYKAIRLFKDRYGETPYLYFKRTRLQMAAALILTGDSNMMEVASRIGYASESKFAIAFKKQFGVRPKHFLAHIKESYNNIKIE
jgi:AraC-like DNA-binding protein